MTGPSALAGLPLPVVVVTATDGGERSCATATATYASLDPAMVVVPLRSSTTTYRLATASGRFAVAVLGGADVDVAAKAGRRWEGDDKPAAAGLPTIDGPGGDTAVAGSGTVLWCELASVVPAGDHHLVVARVLHERTTRHVPAPMVRFQRRYHDLGDPLPVPPEERYPI